MEIEFFEFAPKHIRGELQIEPTTKYYSFKLLEDTASIVTNSRYVVKKGNKVFDLVTYLNWSQFLISDKFKKVLENGGFNGYKCFPAHIEGVSDLFYGWLNINEAGPIIKENRDAHVVWFDLNTWNNYDIFHLKNTFMNICTKKVKEAIEEDSITNIEFNPCYGFS